MSGSPAKARALRLFIASSLDGYIARADGSIDWLFHDADYGYAPFWRGIDTVVMGRKTYDVVSSFDEYPYTGREAWVFSRTRSGDDGRARFFAGDPSGLVRDLKGREGGDLWLVGGGEVTRGLLADGLIDEIVVSIHPILLGRGVPLFLPQPRETPLTLAGCESFPSGLVQLTYHLAPGGEAAGAPA